MKALQKLPEQRFASADDFAGALAAVRIDGPVLPPPGAGTVRMAHAGEGNPRAMPGGGSPTNATPPPPGGGTIRMSTAPAGARSLGLGLWVRRATPRWRTTRWFGRARRVLPSLSLVGLVALAAAGVTVALLLAARVAGLVR